MNHRLARAFKALWPSLNPQDQIPIMNESNPPNPQPTFSCETHLDSTDDGRLIIAVPPGHKVHLFQGPQNRKTVAQTVSLRDTNSLKGYLKRMVTKPQELALALDFEEFKVSAILDHAENADKPNLNEHRALVKLEVTPELKKLEAHLNRFLNQEQLSDFLTEISPVCEDEALINQAITNFEALRETKVVSRLNPRTGERMMTFSDQQAGEQVCKIPENIALTLPLWHGAPPIRIEVALRWKILGGQPQFKLLCPLLTQYREIAMGAIQTDLQTWADELKWPVTVVAGNYTTTIGLNPGGFTEVK